MGSMYGTSMMLRALYLCLGARSALCQASSSGIASGWGRRDAGQNIYILYIRIHMYITLNPCATGIHVCGCLKRFMLWAFHLELVETVPAHSKQDN